MVLDAFMGSGTTAVACINTNRNFVGFELDEVFHEVAENRVKEARVASSANTSMSYVIVG